ncbi:GNAT family N-acetyltransferase [Streptomyces sp. Ag109_O5-10]|uniref:GNAT family N-acetyltransferase n=1 Tax=Streptomyces sp. Ag109_O5-10 TaxID=1855349 RepID=UPI0035268E9D
MPRPRGALHCGRTPAARAHLPGGTLVPAAGVTAVGVLPSHRRRGVLSASMRRQLVDLRAGGPR